MRSEYIAIEGNIGAGKTTLASMLAKDWNATLMLEQFDENPFLPLFYQHPEKYSFPLELSFLGERFEQLKKTLVPSDMFHPMVVSDYYILKSLLFARINLAEAEYNLFHRLFYLIFDSFPKPDKLVYLNTSIADLQQNIRKRGRHYEQDIKDDYLEKLQESYMQALKEETRIPVLLMNTANLDFVTDLDLYQQIKNEISAKRLPGLYIIEF